MSDEEERDDWDRRAKRQGIHCKTCGRLVLYDDLTAFRDTKQCAECHLVEKPE